jgi:hypothetical protein
MLAKILSGGIVGSVGKILDSLHTSEEEKLLVKVELQKLENELNLKQMDINLADARSTASGLSGFMQRSWRPLIGMSCAIAIFWEYVCKQFIMFFFVVFEVQLNEPLPKLPLEALMPLVLSLLGMASLRTYEKKSGVSK